MLSRLFRTVVVVAFVSVATHAQEGGAAAPGDKPASPGAHPKVRLSTTLGDIVLELDAAKAPITVHNFVQYADAGFYNGTIFHRVISTFMVQGGGHLADLSEKKEGLRPSIRNEWRNGLKNQRGTIAMARKGGDPHSATAQFFINVVDNDRLDQPQPDGAAYAVFGRVVEGMDVVDRIRDAKVAIHEKYPSQVPCVPVEPIEIRSVTVLGELDRTKLAAAAKEAEEALARQERESRAAAEKAEEAQLTEYIAKVEKELGKPAQRTASGLVSFVLREGDGPSPKPTDTVKVHYTGWLLDGTEFDSSVKRGPIEFPLNGVIKGWTEGVGLMKIGEKRKLIIPFELAYGARGRPPVIPPRAPLVFDVELLEIR
ncbi:MAG: peptidylprolyl isomerase [Phycisphaerae bacterium]|jgi:FKBP-type peptidyl-prolyl cis-trans isomerase/cyclophilin family peptidyl-prolyl cis-trans isomerase|nr:peptidylprolyl isomerase [Phycisphaerae bacterium]NUQ49574.1 peptidylprolyl isomerase [Phycisphaerae bacterium]